MVAQRSEFTVSDTYPYNRSNPIRWIFSHVLRYKLFFFLTVGLYFTSWIANAYSRILIGDAAGEIIAPTAADGLLKISLVVLFVLLLTSISDLIGSLLIETIAQRMTRDSREELYISLLGKSQTFHDRQRVGDIMARATDDMNQM
nr:ABC transporter ATP-binding protein [Anaerolineae bacterium]